MLTDRDLKHHEDRFSLCMDVNPQIPQHAQELLFQILKRINSNIIVKFEKGQLEHGGKLLDRNLIKDMSDEAIDQLIYVTGEQIKRNEI